MGAALGLVQLLALGAVIFVAAMIVHTVRSLTRPPRRTYAWALSRNVPGDPGELDTPLAFEPFAFRGRRHDLQAWRIEGLDPAGPRVALVHGWGSSRIGALVRIPALARLSREILVCDLEGHGESPGTSRMGTSEHEDIRAMLTSAGAGAPTLLYGWSMGAGVALRTARDFGQELGIAGVIAESPYVHAVTPARNVIRLQGHPVALNLAPAMAWIGLRLGIGPRWRGFARDAIARGLSCPVLVIHGADDPVCPIGDGRSIADAAPDGTLAVIDGAGHNNLWTDPALRERCTEAVGGFVRGRVYADAGSAPIA